MKDKNGIEVKVGDKVVCLNSDGDEGRFENGSIGTVRAFGTCHRSNWTQARVNNGTTDEANDFEWSAWLSSQEIIVL